MALSYPILQIFYYVFSILYHILSRKLSKIRIDVLYNHMSCVTQKGPLGYFWFSIFWKHITLKLIGENFSSISVKISFLWGSKYCVYALPSVSAIVTSWCLHNDTQHFTLVILYLNIVFIAQWLFDVNSKILHCCDVFARRQNLCKPQSIIKQTRVNFYLPGKYDVISQLCHSYAKGPFCVARLISVTVDTYLLIEYSKCQENFF